MTDESKGLKPCPFCGSSDATLREAGDEMYVVSCNACNAEGGYHNNENESTTPENAADFWNHRAAPPTPKPDDMAEVVEAATPFDDALGEDDDDYPDNTKVTINWLAHTGYTLTLGDFRRLRAALAEIGGEHGC